MRLGIGGGGLGIFLASLDTCMKACIIHAAGKKD